MKIGTKVNLRGELGIFILIDKEKNIYTFENNLKIKKSYIFNIRHYETGDFTGAINPNILPCCNSNFIQKGLF
jgi:hypothetical protein